MKPHMLAIIQDVIFPIMQYTEDDAELWEADPYEYIRTKFGKRFVAFAARERFSSNSFPADIYDDYSTPVPAAQSLIHAVCKSRKGILQKAMQFLMGVSIINAK